MHSRSTRDPEQTQDQDPTHSEGTPEKTQEDPEEETQEEEEALETPSQEDSWQEEEPRPEQPGLYPSYSMGTAPKQGCSSKL